MLRVDTDLDMVVIKRQGQVRFLKNLKKIDELKIHNDNIVCVEDIDKLPNLKRLELPFNPIGFPEKICNLKDLRYLDLKMCRINSIPKNIKNLINLEELVLTWNKLEEIPEEIKELKNLKHLCVHGNSIKKIPEWINDTNITLLCIKENPLIEKPELKIKEVYM